MNTMHKLWVTLSTWTVPKAGSGKEAGAGLIEYTAIVVLVAAIAFGIYNLNLVGSITTAISTNVDRILEGPE
ncbi:hypothetical protein [Nocardiopsis nanhaiensis]